MTARATGERIRQIISENLKEHIDFDIVSNPEFLREGSAIEDFMRPNRVVLGARNQQAVAIMQDLYKPLYLIETPFVVTDLETAELIKYASNSFLATKISFVNELANLCEKVGADVHVVAKGMGLDRRIGPKFLHPGPGYGGSCLPKDTNALLRMAEAHGVDLKVVHAAVIANEEQKKNMVRKIRSGLGTLKGKTIAMLGISFKPNTDDVREAPSLYLMQTLLKEGARIRAYDPAVRNRALLVKNTSSSVFASRNIRHCRDAYDAAKGADALLLVTEWNQFRNLDLTRIRKLLKKPYFFDLRNVYEPGKIKAEGFLYSCVGRV